MGIVAPMLCGSFCIHMRDLRKEHTNFNSHKAKKKGNNNNGMKVLINIMVENVGLQLLIFTMFKDGFHEPCM